VISRGICLPWPDFITLRWYRLAYIHLSAISLQKGDAVDSIHTVLIRNGFHIIYSVLHIASKSLRVKWWKLKQDVEKAYALLFPTHAMTMICCYHRNQDANLKIAMDTQRLMLAAFLSTKISITSFQTLMWSAGWVSWLWISERKHEFSTST